MSLIEEALRKQREESERESGKRDVSKPLTLTPPPIPPAEPSPSPDDTVGDTAAPGRPWIMVAGLFLGGTLILVLIIGLLIFGWHLWQQRPGQTAVSISTIPAVTTNVQAKAASPAPVQAPVPVATSAPPVSVAVPEPPAATQAVVTAAVTPTNTVPPPPKIVAPPPKPLPVIWPRLTVSGIIGGGKKGYCAAIVNGRTLTPGEYVEGVKVMAVEGQKVRLVFQGEERTLSAGGTTE